MSTDNFSSDETRYRNDDIQLQKAKEMFPLYEHGYVLADGHTYYSNGKAYDIIVQPDKSITFEEK